MRTRLVHFGITALLVLVSISLGGSLYGQTCPTGMISYHKLNEADGPVYMDSYGPHDAMAPSAMPGMVSGASGKGQKFDLGTETYLNIEDHNSFDWFGTANHSIEFWVKYSGTTGTVQVFMSRVDLPYSNMIWWIGAQATGEITWFMKGDNGTYGSITTPGTFNNNQWHHVVAVRNGSMGRNYLYVDGAVQNPGGTTLSNIGSLSGTAPITIGAYLEQGVNKFHTNAAIDEIAIYNRMLEASEIINHYNNIFQYQIGYCSGDEPMFISDPIIHATVDQPYVYDVDASGNSAPTYSLIESPPGMSINSLSGEINWTPQTASANGKVTVRATNNKGFVDQSFHIFIADDPICRANMIAYWDFDIAGAPGRIEKVEGKYTLTGEAPQTVPGIAGNALDFDGINDSLNLMDIEEPFSDIFFDWDNVPSFSIELWMRSSASPSQNMVLVGRDEPGNSTHWWVGIQTDGSVRFVLRDYPSIGPNSASVMGGSVLDGTWHHIVATYDAFTDDMKLFVDKVEVGSTNQNFLNFGSNEPLNIGCLNTGADMYWYDGVMDELGFYNVALQSFQISANYDNAVSGNGACIYNYAPMILSTPDSTGTQGQPYSYEVVATDVNEGDVLNISMLSKPDWLDGFAYTPGDTTAIISGTPGGGDVGPNSAVVRVSDGRVSVDQLIQINVLNVNDPPEFVSSPVTTVDQNANYSYTALADDPDGDDLTYSATVLPSWMSFDPETRVLSGVAANEHVGLNNVTLRASDGTLHVDQSFQVDVKNVNDAPEFTSDPITTADQNALYRYVVSAVDPDGDQVTFSGIQVPAWLNFNPATRELSGTPGSAEIGFHNVTLRVSDGSLEADQSFQIQVIDVDDAPKFESTPVTTVNQDQFYTYTVLASDEEGDPISYSAPILPQWLSFSTVTRILSGTPTNDHVGIHDVIIRASSGSMDTDQAFQIQVINVNDAPEFTSTPPTVAKMNQPFLYQVTADDPDGDDLSFTATNLPSWLNLTTASSTAILSGTPQQGDLGSVAFIIRVSDGMADEVQAVSLSVVDATGIGDNISLVNKVYPNPVTDKVYFEMIRSGEGLLKIMDIKGSVLKEVKLDGRKKLSIDLSDVPAEMYFYSVTLDGETGFGKLIKK